MNYKYAVLGAGRQGIAAAYDLAKFGQAEEILLVDINPDLARIGAERVNKLIGKQIVTDVEVDISDTEEVSSVLEGVASFISAAHYSFNPLLTEIAIRIRSNMCDLGGETNIVREQMKKNEEAKAAGISIVPDCGMGPGMNISLATYAMSLLDKPREVSIWDGGLPQKPNNPPWNYLLTFNFDGLINEYEGHAYFLRDGQIVKVPCFDGFEELDFPSPLGRLEAAVTSGGLSTAPWTFEGQLDSLENKTLRYPGHWDQFKAFAQLGLFGQDPIKVGDAKIVPRDVFSTMIEPKITQPEIRDVGIIRVRCVGEKGGDKMEAIVELVDYYDEKTGFTAMQRLTGWHASIVAILAAQERIRRGVIPVELAVPGSMIVEEAARRGFSIQKRINPLK